MARDDAAGSCFGFQVSGFQGSELAYLGLSKLASHDRLKQADIEIPLLGPMPQVLGLAFMVWVEGLGF